VLTVPGRPHLVAQQVAGRIHRVTAQLGVGAPLLRAQIPTAPSPEKGVAPTAAATSSRARGVVARYRHSAAISPLIEASGQPAAFQRAPRGSTERSMLGAPLVVERAVFVERAAEGAHPAGALEEALAADVGVALVAAADVGCRHEVLVVGTGHRGERLHHARPGQAACVLEVGRQRGLVHRERQRHDHAAPSANWGSKSTLGRHGPWHSARSGLALQTMTEQIPP
jgi:hypothetical protein